VAVIRSRGIMADQFHSARRKRPAWDRSIGGWAISKALPATPLLIAQAHHVVGSTVSGFNSKVEILVEATNLRIWSTSALPAGSGSSWKCPPRALRLPGEGDRAISGISLDRLKNLVSRSRWDDSVSAIRRLALSHPFPFGQGEDRTGLS